MTRALQRLAAAAGLAVRWTDANGRPQRVKPDVLRTVLAALDLPAWNERQIAESVARSRSLRRHIPPLVVVGVGDILPGDVLSAKGRSRLIAEDGHRLDLSKGRAPHAPGYYALADSDRHLAVVPDRAHTLPHAMSKAKGWGVAVQLYALRGGTSPGFGDFAALGDFAEQAAVAGAEAVAISPVHALFGARPDHIGPYSPSSRLFLNPLYAALERPAQAWPGDLIDWPRAHARKLTSLRRVFDAFRHSGKDRAAFDAFVRAGGKRLLDHARFEARDLGRPDDDEVRFQLFLQWRADHSLAAAQARARAAGMGIGLIADIAVGMDPAGSHAWSVPDEVLRGLSIGAPPDIYNSAGQNWGLTGFSPHALMTGGYDGFIATLRAAMRHAGGIRLDHAMGLKRLWVIPGGASPQDGVYLHYPFEQMLGLLALESRRHQAVVIAEDLGTVPRGFRARIAHAGISGMRVLWFERDARGGFLPPEAWDGRGIALSTTHDLPTLAGWWRGNDMQWRARFGMASAGEKKIRAREKRALWKTLRQAGCAQGPPPKQARRFADAAFTALARTICPLVLLPVEDFIGETQQPNLPGTTDRHPNWRRRLKPTKPFATRDARRRAAILNGKRP